MAKKHALLSVAIFAAGPALVAGASFAPTGRHPAGRVQAVRHETARPIFERALPNVPGKSLIAVEVTYPPGTASAPHRHPSSAFIYAYVVSGEIVSAVGNEPPRIYRAGQSFYEAPGAHHRVSRNASTTSPAKLLAVFVADSGKGQLVFPDRK
ncbi:MAG TPA: cupin domain-containing protein [Sphingomicrobium sp.]|jgi:quercetin dioxygenase-like cupin family protein|nr:cupin domain-containing protein [Sphingomicrobium sp.]